jgi:phosphatidylglycerophosphate synthase
MATAPQSQPAHDWQPYFYLPNLLCYLRIVLVGVGWYFALRGDSWWVGISLMFAALTDFVDGTLARRLHQQSAWGSRIDSIADQLLLASAIAWMFILRPGIVTQHPWLIGMAIFAFVADIAVGYFKFGQIANLHLWSSKVSAILMVLFMLDAYLRHSGPDGYSTVLLYAAAISLILCCLEDIAIYLTRDHVDEHIGSVLRQR